jgi:HJR/Mrr/RecB family endonuclease
LEGHGKSDHWKIMEDAIAAILRNLGVSVIQTGRRGDGGIDLLLRTTNVPLGVGQVKHSKNKIGVSVLRELVGTSMLNNSKHGILVASSKFTSGAYGVQDLAKQNAGLSIELIDGPEVLKALKLTTRTAVTRLGDLSGIAHPAVHIIYEAVPV